MIQIESSMDISMIEDHSITGDFLMYDLPGQFGECNDQTDVKEFGTRHQVFTDNFLDHDVSVFENTNRMSLDPQLDSTSVSESPTDLNDDTDSSLDHSDLGLISESPRFVLQELFNLSRSINYNFNESNDSLGILSDSNSSSASSLTPEELIIKQRSRASLPRISFSNRKKKNDAYDESPPKDKTAGSVVRRKRSAISESEKQSPVPLAKKLCCRINKLTDASTPKQLTMLVTKQRQLHPEIDQHLALVSEQFANEMKGLEERLKIIYKSFPSNRSNSCRDAYCYRRVKSHLMAFKAHCMFVLGKAFSSLPHEDLFSLNLLVWRYVDLLPEWSQPSHNDLKKNLVLVIAARLRMCVQQPLSEMVKTTVSIMSAINPVITSYVVPI